MSHHRYRSTHCTRLLRTCRATRDVPQGRMLHRRPNLRTDRSCDRFFFSMAQVSTRRKLKGNYALHGHTVTVEWIGGRLRAPLIVVYVPDRAQIVSLYDDGVPKRARKRSRVRVIGWCYPEAAAASSTSTTVGTECELIDCSRVPIHSLAARYRRTSRSACGPGGMDESRRIAYRHIGNRCTR